jgi:hypothetical protein
MRPPLPFRVRRTITEKKAGMPLLVSREPIKPLSQAFAAMQNAALLRRISDF